MAILLDNINDGIYYNSILTLLNSTVKSNSIPGIANCPICRGPKMMFYKDPNCHAGYWYSCDKCGFAGDGLELFGAVRRIKSIPSIISRMQTDNLILRPTVQINVNAYTNMVNERHKVMAYWKKSLKNMEDLAPDHIGALEMLKIWKSWSSGDFRQRYLRTRIGASTRKEIRNMLGYTLPKNHWSTFLIFPYYDVPGRIQMLTLFNGRQRFTIMTQKDSQLEGGLWLLDEIDPDATTVLALGDFIVALQLQAKWLTTQIEPLPMIAWEDFTDLAWDSLNPAQLIFWDKEPSARVFNQARKNIRAFVALEPVITNPNPTEPLLNRNALSFVNKIKESALPWEKAFYKWFMTLPSDEAANVLEELQFTQQELAGIMEYATSGGQRYITNMLTGVVIPSIIEFNGRTIEESIDGISILHHQRPRELIADFTLIIEKTIYQSAAEKTYFSGIIKLKNKAPVTFMEEAKVIERDFKHWVCRMLSKVGYPYINNRYEKHLLDIALRFHPPKHMVAGGKVGYEVESNKFTFPLFYIKDGVVINDPILSEEPVASMPANREFPALPSRKEMEIMTSHNKPKATAWAIMAAVMSNIVCESYGEPPRPIGIVSYRNGMLAGAVMAERISEQLRLPTYEINRNFHKDMISGYDVRTNLPTMIQCEDRTAHHRASLIDTTTVDNIIINVSRMQALSLATRNFWILIDTPAMVGAWESSIDFWKLIPFIAWLQRSRKELPDGKTLPKKILTAMYQWITSMFELDCDEIFFAADNLLQVGSTGQLAELLMLIMHFTERKPNNRLSMMRLPLYPLVKNNNLTYPDAPHIVEDKKNGAVIINMDALGKFLHNKKLGIPKINIPQIIKEADRRSILGVGKINGHDALIVTYRLWQDVRATFNKIK